MALLELAPPLLSLDQSPSLYKQDPTELGRFDRSILYDELLERYQGIYTPVIEAEKRNIYVPRDVLELAGIKFEGFDALWGKTFPDGNVPEEDREKLLTFEFGRYHSTIGAVDQNVKLALNFNTQGSLWSVDVRKMNLKDPYVNPELVKSAKRALGLSTQEVEIGVLGYRYDSFKRQEEFNDHISIPLDINNPRVVSEDYDDAQAHLNVIGLLALRNKLPH